MRILVAPDKFKGSLGAAEVAEAIAAGLRDIFPHAEISLLPVADGGEGTASVICTAVGGEWHLCAAHDPLGRLVSARYCTVAAGTTAVMEMSETSGLGRVSLEQRDPVRASSFGIGEMLLDAARRSVSEIIIGLGGSATNDGGFGMARALGFRFLDDKGSALLGPVSDLLHLARIEKPKTLRLPAITAAVDVRNQLLGDNGATRVFAAQKGATSEQVELLEKALTRLADVVAQDVALDQRTIAGSGAAGGLGFALLCFCSAQIRSGFDVVAECIGLEAAVQKADIVITGEGRLDAQTLEGKAPAGVARLARKHGKRCFAIVGTAESAARDLFDEVFVLARDGISTAEAIADAERLLQMRARELAKRLL